MDSVRKSFNNLKNTLNEKISGEAQGQGLTLSEKIAKKFPSKTSLNLDTLVKTPVDSILKSQRQAVKSMNSYANSNASVNTDSSARDTTGTKMFIFWGLLLIFIVFILYKLFNYLANLGIFKRKEKDGEKDKELPKNNMSELEDTLRKYNNDDQNDQKKVESFKSDMLNSGYCFVGKINDVRHCAKVTEKDECLSGNIYPSKDICINPSLSS